MPDITEYKCPNCGASVKFDSASQKMKCPYCDTEFDVSALMDRDEQLKSTAENDMEWSGGENEWQPGEEEGMRVYICNSCGGEIIADENTGASECPFCGSPVIMKSNFSGELRPDMIIPFKLDKKAAKEEFAAHLLGKKLLPKAFKRENHIDEIKGVYVPFWLFDCDVEANISYKAQKVKRWSDSNYNYTQTSFYSVNRAGSVGFDKISADASTSMPDDLMDSIEPYDYADGVDFQTAYLSGYLADKYDVSVEDNTERVNKRIRKSAELLFAETVNGYSHVEAESSDIRQSNGRARYALLPVWLLTTKWKNKSYIFAMNGQTGKFVGNLPLDKGAYYRWFIGLFAGVGLPAAALAVLLTMLL